MKIRIKKYNNKYKTTMIIYKIKKIYKQNKQKSYKFNNKIPKTSLNRDKKNKIYNKLIMLHIWNKHKNLYKKSIFKIL